MKAIKVSDDVWEQLYEINKATGISISSVASNLIRCSLSKVVEELEELKKTNPLIGGVVVTSNQDGNQDGNSSVTMRLHESNQKNKKSYSTGEKLFLGGLVVGLFGLLIWGLSGDKTRTKLNEPEELKKTAGKWRKEGWKKRT